MLFVCRNIIHTTYGSLRDQQQQHKENGKIEGGHGEREGGTVRYIIETKKTFERGNEETKQKNMRLLLLLLLLYYYYYSQLPKSSFGELLSLLHTRSYIYSCSNYWAIYYTQVRVVAHPCRYTYVYIDISLKLSLSVYPYLRLLFFNEDTSYIGRSI